MDLLIKQRIPTELNSPGTVYFPWAYCIAYDGYKDEVDGNTTVENSYGNSPGEKHDYHVCNILSAGDVNVYSSYANSYGNTETFLSGHS